MKVPQVKDVNNRRIYIAGPMTGIKEYNFPKFNEAESKLIAAGWDVCNPAKIAEEFVEGYATVDQIDKDPMLRSRLIKTELDILRTCQAIYLLSGWEKSSGAKTELAEAIEVDADVYLEKDNDCDKNIASYIRYTLNEAEANLRVDKDRCDRYVGAAEMANERAAAAKRKLDELASSINAAKHYIRGECE